MKDAIKYCKTLYTFDKNEDENKIFETNGSIMKLITDLTNKIKEKKLHSSAQNSTRIAEIYFTQKLLYVKNDF